MEQWFHWLALFHTTSYLVVVFALNWQRHRLGDCHIKVRACTVTGIKWFAQLPDVGWPVGRLVPSRGRVFLCPEIFANSLTSFRTDKHRGFAVTELVGRDNLNFQSYLLRAESPPRIRRVDKSELGARLTVPYPCCLGLCPWWSVAQNEVILLWYIPLRSLLDLSRH